MTNDTPTSVPNLMTPEARSDPYPLYARLRSEQPVARVDPGGMYAVSRHEDVVAVFRNPQVFSSAASRAMWTPSWLASNPIAYSLVATDPPEHTRLRSLVSRAFDPRAMARLEPRVREIAAELASRLGAHPEVDFVAELGTLLPARVIAEVLGLDPALHKNFTRWAEAIASITPVTPPERHDNIRTSIAEMEGYLRDVIADRRNTPTSDLVSVLMQSEASGDALSDEEVLPFLFLILGAGFETTAHLLALSLRILAAHPELYAELRAEPALIPGFLDEVLRYDPPTHGIVRFASTDTTLAGTDIAAGSMVIVLLASANRDERRFPDADRFDMRRVTGKDVAFGHGIHFCVGAALARLEGRIALEEIVRQYDRVEAVPGEVAWNYSIIVRGPTALPLRFHPATSSG